MPLNRTFRELSSSASERDESDLAKAFYVSDGLGWRELLKDFRVVILAGAGSGKTEELRAITAQLRSESKDAFFLKLENIPEHFRMAFDIGKVEEFEEWLASGREGWLFLDSVDEARLRHPRDFELALRRVGEQLKLVLDQTHIFLSGRMSAWRPKTDLEKAKAYLPFSPVTHVAAESAENVGQPASDIVDDGLDTDDEDAPSVGDMAVSSAAVDKKESTAPFRILTLQDLSRDQVETFVRARGVVDTKTFGDAIERADAWSFAALPQDLDDLAASWLQRGQIGTRREIMQDGVERRLRERDQERADTVPLTEAKALEGARLLAAAATLGRNPAIQVPDGANGLGGIPVDKILTDWSPAERKALLERPVFDAAVYGAVRFHHRTVREYLTAEWLREKLLHPASRRAIEDIFFRTQYGIQVIVPVMRPVLPWVALYDDRIRERVRRIAPEVLFEGGDPTSLPLSTRQEILAEVAKELASGHSPKAPTDFAAVQRFAHVDLSDDIRRLLQQHADDAQSASFLLRMVWLGQIKAALAEAKQQALSPKAEKYQRMAAIRAVDAVGAEKDMRDICEAILGAGRAPDREWLNELVNTLKGRPDDIEWVLRAVARTEAPPRYTVDHLQNGLAKLIGRLPIEQLPKILDGLYKLLCTEPYVNAGYCKISTRFGWLLHPAATAVERLMEARNTATMSASALGILGMLPASRYSGTEIRDLKTDFSKLVPYWIELNRTLFWAEVARARGDLTATIHGRVTRYWQAHSSGAFWKLSAEDFDYFLDEVGGRALQDDKLVALSAAFQAYILMGRDASARKRLKEAASGNQEIVDQLGLFLHPPKSDDAITQETRKWQHQATTRARKERENLRKSREYIVQNLQFVRDPGFADANAVSTTQWYLYHRTRDKADQKGKWTTGSWRSLIPDFGEETARAYRDGAILHWRRAIPQLLSEGATPNTTTASTVFGLAGLAIDARETPNWAENLMPNDVVRAWRFASHELNGFPEWLPRLHAAHSRVLANLLMAELAYEVSAETDEGMHYIIDDLAWSGTWAWPALGPRIFALLRVQEPRNAQTLNKLLRMALHSGVQDGDVAALARSRIEDPETRHAVPWYAAWTSVAPDKAIPAFATYLDKFSANQKPVDAAMSYATHLFGDRYSDFPVGRAAFKQPQYLEQLYVLLHRHILRSEDIDRIDREAYSPTLRDRAQNSRDAIFNQLNSIAGKEAYVAMTKIAKAESDAGVRRWIEYRAHQRAEQDADMAAWSPEQVREFNDKQERTPANHRELAELAVNHLLDLKDDLENGDSSIAEVLLGIDSEEVMRNFLGHELERMSSGRYQIPQEEELADAKRPDLRFHGIGISGPVPTELKLADKWSGPELVERLENQLSGDYLRDRRSSRGVFLMVNRSKDRNRWQLLDGSRVEFDGVVAALQKRWEVLSPNYPNIEEITVIGIDLTKRKTRGR